MFELKFFVGPQSASTVTAVGLIETPSIRQQIQSPASIQSGMRRGCNKTPKT